jgi:hypothetical protein
MHSGKRMMKARWRIGRITHTHKWDTWSTRMEEQGSSLEYDLTLRFPH